MLPSISQEPPTVRSGPASENRSKAKKSSDVDTWLQFYPRNSAQSANKISDYNQGLVRLGQPRHYHSSLS